MKEVTSTTNVFINLDNSPSTGRQTALYRDISSGGGALMGTTIPGGTQVRIDPRGSIAGTVPLQGRSNMTMPASEV